jgi:hypothetical protein
VTTGRDVSGLEKPDAAGGERVPGWMPVAGSALAFCAAYIVTTAVHELAHALAAAFFGLDPVWHGATTPHVAGTAAQETVVALAGPICSVISGTTVLALSSRARGYPGLLLHWLGLLSVAGFCGYLISAAFATSGDIADALVLQHAPPWAAWLAFVAGLVGLLSLARGAAVRLVSHAPAGWSTSQALRRVGLVAVPVAVPLLVAGGIPVGPPLIAQLTIVALLVVLSSMFRSRMRRGTRAAPPDLTMAVLVFVVLSVVEWLVLRPGVRL